VRDEIVRFLLAWERLKLPIDAVSGKILLKDGFGARFHHRRLSLSLGLHFVEPRPKNAVFFGLAVCPKNDVYFGHAWPDQQHTDLKARILARIESTPDSVWTPADFVDIGSRHAVDKALQRLVAVGDLRRIDRGLYDQPRLNILTGQPTVGRALTTAA
jgi:hypothetical protein